MFDSMNDSEMKDKILMELIEKMEEVMAPDVKGRSGLSVEVAAPDKDALKAGLSKASDVLEHAPAELGEGGANDSEGHQDDEGGSDEERLAALLGGDEDEEDEDKKSRF